MTSTRSPRHFRALALAPVVALSCGLLVLAGCSASSSATTAPSGAAGQNGGGNGGGGMGNDPGRVSGEIASVDGKTLQIQDGESQTAVTYTSKTTFTAQVAGSVSDIAKGDCVMVFSSSTAENATEVTATSVTASTATDGTCSSGFGGGAGGGGARPSGAPSGQPSAGGQAPDGQNPPSGAPSGAPGGGPSGMPNGGGRPRSGQVTAVDGDTFTVEVTQRGSDTKTKVAVKTTSDTKITVTEKSKASAAKVGVCATVNGKADDTGAVKANTITLRDAGDDGCSMRRGNR